MKLLALVFLLFIGFASASPVIPLTHAPVLTELVNVVTDGSGNFAHQTSTLNGELMAIEYLNGNFSGLGSIVITDSNNVAVDTYNVSPGSAEREPGIKYLTSTDAWARIPIFGKLWVNVTAQAHTKYATVLIIYR